MDTCIFCRKNKGKRLCPALGSKICPPCCGANRVIRIQCPSACPYLSPQKTYKQGKLAKEFVALNNEYLKDAPLQVVNAWVILEILLYKHIIENPAILDHELIGDLEAIRYYLSPVIVPEIALSQSGEDLLEEIQDMLQESPMEKVDQEVMHDALDRYIKLAKTLSGEKLASRDFILGFKAFMEKYKPQLANELRKEIIHKKDERIIRL